jgi:hypothetical protein
MLLFDIAFGEDDLAVLSAYVRAQDIAEAAKKSQPQGESASTVAATQGDDADEFDEESLDDGDVTSAQTSQSASRRAHTWISRLREVEGVPPDRLAPIHGRLIAHGLLLFQLQGREDGVVYRVTSAGRQRLNAPNAEAA